MAFATAHTITLQGAHGHLVDVQVDVSQGVVKTAMVGRPDASISEARDRCRAAVTNSGFQWPNTRRVTVLLSPADLPKRGPHFDLAIAVGTLAAAGVIPKAALEGIVFIGELTLDGRLRAVPGVLPMAMAAKARDIARVVIPEPHAGEAAMIPGMSVVAARSLAQVVAVLCGDPVPDAPPVPSLSSGPLLTWRGEDRMAEVDLGDLLGMADAKYALEVAAAGGHHLMLSGPKGAGKTSLAERLPGLLPDLTVEECLELSAIYSLAGCLPPDQTTLTRPPFRAPHHSATRTAMLGGGTGRIHPGEVSRAHTGALFLDEFPLFNSDIVDALREPLESGEITIARGDEIATFPARTMVVLACNPCPCGDYHPLDRDNRCECPEVRRREYRKKIGGPVADRVDITRHVEPVRARDRHAALDPAETTSVVRARVIAARARQRTRYEGTRWRTNGAVPGPVLRQRWPLADEGARLLDERVYSGSLTRRGATRVHRLAWTVADLRGLDLPGLGEVDTALRLRTGEPLLLEMLGASGAA